MDYTANSCQVNMDSFLELFIGTGYAEQFAAGVPKYVSGISGTELVIDVLTKSGTDIDFPQAQIDYDYSPQYWCGWILAYYQWYTGRSFKEIAKHISPCKRLKSFILLCTKLPRRNLWILSIV